MPGAALPLLNNRFRIDVEAPDPPQTRANIAVASIRGLHSSASAAPTLSSNIFAWLRRPRRPTALRLELRRAQGSDRYFYDWHAANLGTGVDLRTVTITQLDDHGEEAVNRWQLAECWVCEWHGPSFDAIDVDVAYETLILCYGYVHWCARS